VFLRLGPWLLNPFTISSPKPENLSVVGKLRAAGVNLTARRLPDDPGSFRESSSS
jgi:hypothetical protein